MHYSYLVKHLNQPGTEGKNRFNMEVYCAAFIKKNIQIRLQVFVRCLVADKKWDMGQGMENQGNICVKTNGWSAHKEINNIGEQIRMSVGKILENPFTAAGEQILPFFAALNIPKRYPGASDSLMLFMGNIGEERGLDPGDDMTLRSHPALLVDLKILAQRVDYQLLPPVVPGGSDNRCDTRQLQATHLFFKTIYKLCLIRLGCCFSSNKITRQGRNSLLIQQGAVCGLFTA